MHFSGVQSRYFPISRREKENLENREKVKTKLQKFIKKFK